MGKKSFQIVIILLGISIVANIGLIFYAKEIENSTIVNSQRLKYIEDHYETSLSRAVQDYAGEINKESSIVTDLNWSVSDLFKKENKTASLKLDFKLKKIEADSNVYVSIEEGTKEAELVKVQIVNETTYALEKLISVLSPIRIDLVVEKYGDKQIENIIDEEDLYRKFLGETGVDLLDFEYQYEQGNGVIASSFEIEAYFDGGEDITLISADVVISKEGIPIEKIPLEELLPTDNAYRSSFNFGVSKKRIEMTETDSIDYSVIFVDSNGFIYEYTLAKFTSYLGELAFSSYRSPELVVR